MAKDFVYIVQSSLEKNVCKIGITSNLERRLKEYNNITGKSNNNVYNYLYTCKVKDMRKVENDIKNKFKTIREQKSREIYFYNTTLFKDYIDFIESHAEFQDKIFVKESNVKKKTVKRVTPPLSERGISRKDVMQDAKKNADDEFYTRYEDIEKEIACYDKSVWKGKVIFCNCDDALDVNNEKNSSAFSLYFIKNFEELGLKKLICTHYAGKRDIFNQGPKGYIFTKDGFKEFHQYPKDYTGSFDHPLSIKILNEEADILVTNPPFSKAIEFWEMMIESGKKFLVISNFTNPINTAYIHYFKDEKVWAGHNHVKIYLNQKRQIVTAAGHWYTNLVVKRDKQYNNLKIVPLSEIPEKYKKYDDKGMLLVDQLYIPSNYNREFAVSAGPIASGILEKGYEIVNEKQYAPSINKTVKFARVLIKKI